MTCPCGWYSTCFQGCNEEQIRVRRDALKYLSSATKDSLFRFPDYQKDFDEDKNGDYR